MRPIYRIFTVCCLSAALTACAGGDAPPEDTDDETADPGELESLYPLVDGAEWVYRQEDNGGTFDGVEIVHIETIAGGYDGEDAFLLYDEPNASGEFTESVIVRRDQQAFRVHKEVTENQAKTMIVEYDPGFLRADDAWKTDDAGVPVLHQYLRTEKDGNNQNPVEEDREHEFTVLAIDEELELEFGTVKTVHIKRVRTTGNLAGEEVEHWYAPGIGKVQEYRVPNDALGLVGSREILTSFKIPGGLSGG